MSLRSYGCLVFCGVVSVATLASCSAENHSGPALGASLPAAAPAAAGKRKTFDAPPTSAPAYAPQTYVGYRHPDEVYQQTDETYQAPDSIEVVPQGQAPSPNSDGSQPLPLAGGIITYPDGSTQTADQNGAFVPAQSSYVENNSATVESDPSSGVQITVSDANGKARPLAMQVQGGDIASKPPQNGRAQSQSLRTADVADRFPSLGSLVALPRTAEVPDGADVMLSTVALDESGHATLVDGGSVVWSQPAAGSLSTRADGSARYRAPARGSGIDRFAATIRRADGSVAYKAGVAIAYVGRDRQSRVRVKLTAPDETALPASTRLAFVRTSDQTTTEMPALWFASPLRHGDFVAHLPSGEPFTPFAVGPSGYRAVAFADGRDRFTAGSGDDDTLVLALGAAGFTMPVRSAVAPSTEIRDADLLSAVPRERNLFDPASGLQPLLASPFAPIAGTVPSGTFAGWSFEWQGSASAPTLVLLEASGGRAGTSSATITPFGDGATFAFARYRSTTPLSMGRPLVAAHPNSQLQSDGAWSQSGAPSALAASLAVNLYDSEHQTPGAPAFTERGTFEGSSAGSGKFTGMSVYDASGLALWRYDGSRTAVANGSFSYAARALRATAYSGGTTARRVLASGSNGPDGIAVTLYDGDRAATVSYGFPSAFGNAAAGQGSLVIGSHTLATFSLEPGGLVRAAVGAPGSPGVVPLEFPL